MIFPPTILLEIRYGSFCTIIGSEKVEFHCFSPIFRKTVFNEMIVKVSACIENHDIKFFKPLNRFLQHLLYFRFLCHICCDGDCFAPISTNFSDG